MALTPRHVFRYFKTDGVPSSGKHNPVKAEIIQLLEQLFGVSRGGWVVAQTLADLNGVTPEDQNDGGVVFNDPDPTNNGYYSREAGAWVKGRGFPDTFARVSLSGSGAAQTGEVEPGVNPADAQVFFAKVATANTGAMTLSISGETARDVVNAAGNALSAGEWTGTVLFFLNGDGDYQLLIDAGAAAAAAQSASAAELARDQAQAAASSVSPTEFPSIAAAEALTPVSASDFIRVSGYTTAGDGGGALYKKVASEPAHAGKFSITLDDGVTEVWYELAETVVDIRMTGAIQDPGTDLTDSTPAFEAAWSVSKEVRVPEGRFVVSQLEPPEGTTIYFAGVGATTLKQKANVQSEFSVEGSGSTTGNYDFPMIRINWSNVKLIGGFTGEGNIADDTGEWNHVCEVRSLTGSARVIEGVEICDIHGVDVRGDILYIGGTPTIQVGYIAVGFVTGENIYRSPFSCTGARHVEMDGVDCGHYSYRGLDFEPNGSGSQGVVSAYVRYAQVGNIQLAGNGGNNVGKIKFGTLICDTNIQVESDPPYLIGGGPSSYFDTSIGIIATNYELLEIDDLTCIDQGWSAVDSALVDVTGKIIIHNYHGSGNGSVDPTRGEFRVLGCYHFQIDHINDVVLEANNCLIAETTTYLSISNGSISGGQICNQAGPKSEFHNLAIAGNGVAEGEIAFGAMDFPLWDRITATDFQWFSTSCAKGVLQASSLTVGAFSYNSFVQHTLLSSDINGVYYSVGALQDHYENAVKLPGGYLQINSGILRVKTTPFTSAADGDVVGSQT